MSIRTAKDNILGNDKNYEKVGTRDEDGGTVEVWQNHETGQVEKWWKNSEGAWYVKTDDRTYIRVEWTKSGDWVVDPKDRYDKQSGEWRRKRE